MNENEMWVRSWVAIGFTIAIIVLVIAGASTIQNHESLAQGYSVVTTTTTTYGCKEAK